MLFGTQWISISLILIVASLQNSVTSGQNIINSILGSYREALGIPFDAIADSKEFEPVYDFVIIGAGSGGSVVTNRLTEIREWNVLLLEAGKEEILLTDVPLASTYWTFTDYNWGYKTEPQGDTCLAMNDGRCTWPRGKGLGGTSIVNYMVYTRGNKYDYDEWRDLGNPGWGYSDLLPLFKKSENVGVRELRDSPYRGTKGFLSVTQPPWRSRLAKAHLQAGLEMNLPINDPNGADQLGISYVQVTMKDGRRHSAAKAFLRPIRKRKNLHVAKEARVTRIIIDPNTKSAMGVEFVKNRRAYIVRVSKEVILCAGALNSPQLLMLSGIGPKKHLTELNIPVIANLPVGQNLQDHPSFAGIVFLINETASIIDTRIATNPVDAINYFFANRGPLTSPGGAEVVAFINTQPNNTLSNIPPNAPDIELVFGAGSLSGDTSGVLRRSFGLNDEFYRTVIKPVLGRDGFSIVPIVLKPKSRGYIRLKSKNPFHWPRFYPGYYTNEEDLDTMVRGIKAAIAFSKTKALQRFGTTIHKTPFPGCQTLLWGSDDYWRCAVRQMSNNLHHQVGTCRMGPIGDAEAVVDPELRVHGIKGLRVADASIMPTLPSTHTNAPAFMIGEKAADLIKSTWLAEP